MQSMVAYRSDAKQMGANGGDSQVRHAGKNRTKTSKGGGAEPGGAGDNMENAEKVINDWDRAMTKNH